MILINTILAFISVGVSCMCIGYLQWKLARCTVNKGRHNWKRVNEKCYGGTAIPEIIELHLKCEACGKEIKKTYQI